jgi:hypothetical protein
MRYCLKQEKFYEENTRSLRIFFSAHPTSLRETSSHSALIDCISFRGNTDDTDETDFTDIISVNLCNPCHPCSPFELMYKNR